MTNCNELGLLRKTLDDLFADILAGKLRLPEVKRRLEEIEREAAPLEWEWDSDHVKHVCEERDDGVLTIDPAGVVLSRGPCRVQHCDRCNTVSVAVLHPKCLVLG